MYDLCIIGGGASGMTAAIVACQSNPLLKIIILEKKDIPGKKIYASGNGKCNIANMSCKHIDRTLDFFNSIGVMTKADSEGRVYPCSESASDVAFCMEKYIRNRGVEIITKADVEEVKAHREPSETFFNVKYILTGEKGCEKKTLKSKKLIISTGGKAGPQYGSAGDGYKLAKSLGHEVSKIYPTLTGIECKLPKELKGVREKAVVTLLKNDNVVATESGEVQFNDYGVSGIAVMNLSRFVKLDGETKFKDYKLKINCLPDLTKKQIADILDSRKAIEGFQGKDILRSVVNNNVGKVFVDMANIYENKKGNEISEAERDKLVELLTGWELIVTGARGWKQAQCTGGGIDYSQVDEATMESKIQKGLYFVGEIMDYDGPCGGYNLQHAWETGMRAGKFAVKK